ncbi:MAG: 2OG-Fe(II) oxygenase [Pseudomonadales bacterium]
MDSFVDQGMLNYPLLRDAPVNAQPFPYLVQADCIAQDALAGVLTDFPDIDMPGSVPVSELTGGPAFTNFIAELEGKRFRELLEQKFAINLQDRPVVTTARGLMREKDGRIHTDSRSKLITVLMYFNQEWAHPGGRLRLLENERSIDNYITEVSPLAGTMVAFQVTDNCWHGHTPVTGKRLSLQLNYLVSKTAQSKHSFLHGLSAKVKKAFD